MSTQNKNKDIERLFLVTILTTVVFFIFVANYAVSSSSKPTNTQLGRLVDHENLPAYSKDQDFTKKQFFGVVRVINAETFKAFCSAFVISDDYAISAAHCFVDANSKLKDVEYKLGTETVVNEDTAIEEVMYISTQVVGVNIGMDQALLKGNFKNITKMRINFSPFVLANITDREPLPGLYVPLFALGYPNGIKEGAGYPQGECMQTYDYIRCKGNMFHAMSGGALFDPISQSIVGINFAIGGQGDSYFKLLIGIFDFFNIVVE